MADQDFGDLVLIEQLLELTVRNGLDLCVDQPHVLDQHHAKEGRKDVPDGEVVLSLLRLLGRLRGFRPRSLAAVVAEAEKPWEAPTGRGFHVLGRRVEHVGLPCGAQMGRYRRRRPHPLNGTVAMAPEWPPRCSPAVPTSLCRRAEGAHSFENSGLTPPQLLQWEASRWLALFRRTSPEMVAAQGLVPSVYVG